MALNSSGPISFGGSTVGQSINLELGVSATALASINSTSFRTLAGVASGQISLSNFYGKSNVSYYFNGLLGFNASGGVGTFDTSGNIYAGGTGRPGSLLTVSKIGTSNTLTYSQEIGINSNGIRNIIVSGSSIYYVAASSVYPGPVLNRLSTSTGVTNWPQGGYRNVGGATYSLNSYEPTSLSVNASGDVYVCANGRYEVSKTSYYMSFLVKVGSDGNPVWFIYDTQPGTLTKFFVSAQEVGGYLYTYGTTRSDGTDWYGSIVKRTLASPPAYVASNGVRYTANEFAISGGMYDSVSDAHYLWGRPANGNHGFVAKFNSSLVLQWARMLVNQSGYYNAWAYAVTDSSSNLYVATSGSEFVVIAKYNSSGVPQWVRRIDLTGSSTFYQGQMKKLSIYSDKLLLSWGGGYDNDSSGYAFFVQYPTDGSKSSGTTTLTLAGGRTATLTFNTYSGTDSAPSTSVSAYNAQGSNVSTVATTTSSTSNSKTTTLYSTTL